jgi:restriction system protein
MIPTFEKFLYPFLLLLKNGEKTTSQMVEEIADYLGLTEDDKLLRTKSGASTQLRDRVGWARQYFRRALFIEIPKPGLYRITQRGLDYINSHASLLIEDLLVYPEFAEYYGLPTKKSKNEQGTQTPVHELTPTEQLEQAYESISNDLAADLLNKILEKKDPAFFERLVVDLMLKMGYGSNNPESSQVTKYSGDEGIDGIIYEDKLGLDKIYLQAKQWTTAVVGRPELQKFVGALAGKSANKGVFITTSSFSKEAREYAKGLAQKVVLIDGKELANYMIEFNVGVAPKKIYEVKRIDIDYFEE